jgi:hypothetical protein
MGAGFWDFRFPIGEGFLGANKVSGLQTCLHDSGPCSLVLRVLF